MGLQQASAIELQPGTYFIGDPCYVMSKTHDSWVEKLESCNYFQEPYTERGKTAIAFSPAWGDGVYFDQDGWEYGVDAGLIGAVPLDLLDTSLEEIEERCLGRMVTFSEPFICTSDGGKLRFGHIVIDTDPELEEDRYWEHDRFDELDEDEEEEIYEQS